MNVFTAGAVALLLVQPAPEEAKTAKSLFESGQFQETLDTVAGSEQPSPLDLYLAAMAAQRVQQPDRTREMLDRLRQSQAEGPWARTAASARALLDGNPQGALEAAQSGVAERPGEMITHYQLGAVLLEMGRSEDAAAEFDKATEIDPTFAYAHYYAGAAYQKHRRLDRMSEHFEAFLRLAPSAPEGPAIKSIMRTLRGR